jgi:pimeloyl-ACP methyl ester carboxylesterase
MNNNKKLWGLFVLSLVIILAGVLLTWSVDTSSGKVDVKLVDFIGEDGALLHARLYIPKGVTSDNPAPGVLFMHGGDASSDKYSMFSVEFSRRGYVVLNLDMRGHGFSEGPAELPFGGAPEHGMGGPEALQYLRSLDIVDPNNIACAGHSMGGAACGYASVKYPDDFSAMVFVGSTPSGDVSTSFPRNSASIQALDDGGLVGDSVLVPFTGVEKIEDIESGKVYGSIADGTGHVVYFVNTVHNAEYITPAVIEKAVDWVQKTIPAPNPISPSNQVWIWRYLGSTIALGGAIFFMLRLGALLLQTSYFKVLIEPLPEFKGLKGTSWWVGAILTAVIAPATLFYFHNLTAKAPGIWPFARITGIMGWTVLVGVVTIVLYFVSRYLGKGMETTPDSLGITWEMKLDWTKIGKSLLLALCIIASTYLLVAIVYNVFQVDFRMWNEGLRLMTLRRVGYAFQYVIPFMLAYLFFGANLHGLLRPKSGKASFGKELLSNILIISPWYYIWAIWWGPFEYLKTHPGGPSFARGFMQHWFWALVPVMLMWTVISTYFFRKTGKVYVGAFLNALFVCWVILAEQMLASFVLG